MDLLALYFREQWDTLPHPKVVDNVSSKIFMVTGTNVGLGFEAAVHLAKMRPKLLLVTSRSLAKCEQAEKLETTRKAIRERAAADGVAHPQVAACPLELESFHDVRFFVDKFASDGEGALNTLVANAGVLASDYSQTRDGWEVMLQVNYLSTALLSILLLPHLINTSSSDSPSRLVVVSSLRHHYTPAMLKGVDSWNNILETINNPEFGDGVARYSVTKLLQVIFIRELVSRLPRPTPVIACTVSPGSCESNMIRHLKGQRIISAVQKLFLVRSTEEGSRALVHAAVASDRSMHGRYLSCCQVTKESNFVLTPEGEAFSAKLWDETITLLSRVDHRVPEIVKKYLQAESRPVLQRMKSSEAIPLLTLHAR